MASQPDFLTAVILGGFVFTSGAYIFTFKMWRSLSHQITRLWVKVSNHLQHDLEEIHRRLAELERSHRDD